jgi:hypothetical protein
MQFAKASDDVDSLALEFHVVRGSLPKLLPEAFVIGSEFIAWQESPDLVK